jgi:hypothetical protein
MFLRCQPVCGSISWAYGRNRLAQVGGFSHGALGARLASPISVSAETSQNDRFDAPPADLVERITTVQIGGDVHPQNVGQDR